MIVLGLAVGTVGLDKLTGVPRFTFGNLGLADGLSFTALAIGLFGISEILLNLEKSEAIKAIRPKLRDLIPRWSDLRESAPAIGRGTIVGFIFGIVPGVSHVVSTFVSYAIEKRFSRHPEQFGKGAIAGVAGPETANNATTGTAMIPLLALGIPSIPATAILLSALTIHGVQPGPLLLTEHPAGVLGPGRQHVHRQRHAADPEPAVRRHVREPAAHPLRLAGADHPGDLDHRRLQRQLQARRHLDHGGLGRRRLSAAQVRLRDGAAAAGARARRPAGGELPPGADHVGRQSYATFAEPASLIVIGTAALGLLLLLQAWPGLSATASPIADKTRARMSRGAHKPRQSPMRSRACCASPRSEWAGGPTCWPTRSSAPASLRSWPATRARRTSVTLLPTKYGCRAAASYEEILADRSIAGIINTTPNNVHLETTRRRRQPASTSSSTSRSPTLFARAARSPQACKKAGVVLALGYQRRRETHFRWIKAEIDAGRFGRLVQAECNISRDRLGQFDLSSWRYTAAGMPGGVMLQIGIHYVDVLEMPAGAGQERVGAPRPARASRRQPGRRQHDPGARERRSFQPYGLLCLSLRVLHDEHLRQGGERLLRSVLGPQALKRGDKAARAIATEKNDTIREELEEFARCVRNGGEPETDGIWAARNLAVIKAGVKSAREGRVIEVADVLANGE